MISFRREPGTPLTKRERAELEKLAKMPEDESDTSDIPEWTDEIWRGAVRGKFYRPVKKAMSLRLDADVIAWLKKDGRGIRAGRIGCCGRGC
ncbi:MAG TPA: BrnA antitoxin family protein [Edaphobacter sp.]|nr:BrnA antitoxin family protein [Edaphobacter sp.]